MKFKKNAATAMACASPKTLALPIIHILHTLYIAYMVYMVYILCMLYILCMVYMVYKVSTILSVLSGTTGTSPPGASRRECWSFMATLDAEDCGDLVDHA